MDVKVVENADNCVHITMPATPTGSMELSDEELSNAAGGYTVGGQAPTICGDVGCPDW
jgi:mersacidin/lichenicidin family type 2 lantibiotic